MAVRKLVTWFLMELAPEHTHRAGVHVGVEQRAEGWGTGRGVRTSELTD